MWGRTGGLAVLTGAVSSEGHAQPRHPKGLCWSSPSSQHRAVGQEKCCLPLRPCGVQGAASLSRNSQWEWGRNPAWYYVFWISQPWHTEFILSSNLSHQ